MNMEEIGNYGHISACRITKRRDFMNYCYIKLRKFPVVEFVNFTEIKDFAYISISRVSKTLTIYTKEMTETDYRFRIDFPKTGGYMVFHSRLYHLVNHYELENKMFVFNPASEFYLATSIPVGDNPET